MFCDFVYEKQRMNAKTSLALDKEGVHIQPDVCRRPTL